MLLVAAESREFDGPLAKGRNNLPGWEIDFAARWEDWTQVANGPGAALARQAVDAAIRHWRPDVIVSTGVCGGLTPGLAVGDIVVASKVLNGRKQEYQAQVPGCHRKFHSGTVYSSDRVAVSISDKRSLRQLGADVVEMEAASVAERASKEGIPFYCIRSISDTADEEFELDFNTLRDANGRFSRPRIALAAMRKPFTRIPALLKLDRNTRTAARSLGEFLVDCRF